MFKASLVLTFVSSSWKFLQLFELWKILYSEVAQKITKNYIQSFQVKGHQEAPVADQGDHHQARRPGGAAQPLAAPPTLLGGPHAPWWHLSPHSLSFFPKTWVLPLVLASLLFLSSYLRSLLLATCLSWFLEQVLLGMWLPHPSN